MNPDININEKLGIRAGLENLMRLLAGKVSYFPGSSPAAYPSVSYITHDVTPSTFQMNMCKLSVLLCLQTKTQTIVSSL